MYKILAAVLCFLIAPLYADITLKVGVKGKYPDIERVYDIYTIVDCIYLNASRKGTNERLEVARIDTKSGDLKWIGNDWYINGLIEDRIVIKYYDKKEFFYWDPESNVKEAILYSEENGEYIPPSFQYFQNGIYYREDPRSQYTLAEGNFFTKKMLPQPSNDRMPPGGVPQAISADKMHMLFNNRSNFWSFSRNSEISLTDGSAYTLTKPGFLSNTLIYFIAFTDPNRYLELFDINGNKKESVRIDYGQGAYPNKSAFFFGDLSHALAWDHDCYYLLDTTAFRDWLDEKGYLFHATTAEVVDSQVRVRQNPNLEAKTYGYLNMGDAVEVLDRSGLKVKIDPYGEKYWYKVKRKSDDLEGWAFGAFLKLAKEQGDLNVAPAKEREK